MGGWARSTVGFASLPHKTRPIKIEQIPGPLIVITWSRPVSEKLYAYEDNIQVRVTGGAYEGIGEAWEYGPNWSSYEPSGSPHDRWRIVADPETVSTPSPGFLWPIGGVFPYDRPWDP